jgi:hypothetical protein
MKPRELERVRRHTSKRVNRRIDAIIAETIYRYAGRTEGAITARLDELDEEWDIERVLEAHAATLGLTSLTLATVNRRWVALAVGALGFLLLHATHGWCPPLPILRRLGVRTRGEIEKEKFALRFLRGDFDHIRSTGGDLAVPRLVHALQT